MAGLKFALGMLPKTSKIENQYASLQRDFERYKELEKSDEMKRYLELKAIVETSEFEARKKDILTRKFKDTREYQQLMEFRTLERSKNTKNYFKIRDSRQLSDYYEFLKSDTLKRLKELAEYVKSDELKKAKADLTPRQYKKSEQGKKEKEYIRLLKSKTVKRNKKFEKSQSYLDYKATEKSDSLKKFMELKDFVNSEKFNEFRIFMNQSGVKKFKQSDEYQQLNEFKSLQDSNNIKWYFETKKNYPFEDLESWELVFEDDFSSEKPNPEKWIFRYINGERLLNKPYVLADDQHAFVDGANISNYQGHLSIMTMKQNNSCLSWDQELGFVERDFEYSSDLLSTATRFSTRNGRIQAKIRMGKSSVTQAFSLMADQILPHVDIVRYSKNKIYAGSYWKDNSITGESQEKTGGGRFTRDFFIYTLEWTPTRLIWKINDVVFKEESRGVPDEDMHLVFNASLKKNAKVIGIPSQMLIDWVRVYHEKSKD